LRPAAPGEGLDAREAVVTAGRLRLRPVLLTATTTVLGLIPMVAGWSLEIHHWPPKFVAGAESSAWWAPMAVAVLFGLTVATVLTLVLVPAMFSVAEDVAAAFRRRFLPAEAERRPSAGGFGGAAGAGGGSAARAAWFALARVPCAAWALSFPAASGRWRSAQAQSGLGIGSSWVGSGHGTGAGKRAGNFGNEAMDRPDAWKLRRAENRFHFGLGVRAAGWGRRSCRWVRARRLVAAGVRAAGGVDWR
jgi:hypothetical protein